MALVYLKIPIRGAVVVTLADKTEGTQIVVDDKDLAALKASGLVDWATGDQKSACPVKWLRKGEPLHEFAGVASPVEIVKIPDAIDKG